MSISEKIQLLGKGLYQNIPDELTISNIPTASELDYVGSEDFDTTMLDKILPQAVEENINFRDLLEIDYQWLCRCLRILNYGPYYTVHSVFCNKCGIVHGDYQVNFNTVDCKPLPKDFNNKLKIEKSEFIDYTGDIEFHLPTIQQILNCYKDKAFQNSKGQVNRDLARMCYMISSMKGVSTLSPIEIKMAVQKDLSPADYLILKNRIAELTDYGLRAGGSAQCPKCGSKDAAFVALVDDRFFRPTVDNIRRWAADRNKR